MEEGIDIKSSNLLAATGSKEDSCSVDGASILGDGHSPPPEPPMAARARICLVGALSGDPEMGRAAAAFGVPVLLHSEPEDALALDGASPKTYFVLEEFSGPVFDALYKAKQSILGPTALLQLSSLPECQLPEIVRPRYCLSMKGAVICFTGFRVKEELTRLIMLIHHMGGTIRKDVNAKTTHLIANCCGGDKYQYATSFRVPIVSRTWVDYCWERRNDFTCRAADDAIVTQHKLKVFFGARVCFIGFPEEERQHMTEILRKNGGDTAELDDRTCTHVVVANGRMYDRTPPFSPAFTPDQSNNETSIHRLAELISPREKKTMRNEEVSPSLQGACTKINSVKVEDLNESKFSLYKLEQMSPEGLRRLSENMLLEKSHEDGTEVNGFRHDAIGLDEDIVDKKIKSPLAKLNDSLLNISNHNVSTTCLSNTFDGEKDVPVLPSVGSCTSVSTTSSSKKRSRNSAESNNEFEIHNEVISNIKTEENNWKSPFKRLKIKDSFRFKGKDKPAILKNITKKKKQKDESSEHDDDKNDFENNYLTSTPSPRKDEDNISMCSISSTAKADRSFFSTSGLFDISFSSLRGSKTAKSVSRIRRSMKSLTASFRGERKKKYEKKAKESESDEEDSDETQQNKVSPTGSVTGHHITTSAMVFDVSPVETRTPLTRISENNELETSVPPSHSSPLIFKTPMGKPKRSAAQSPFLNTFSPNPVVAKQTVIPKPDSSHQTKRHHDRRDQIGACLPISSVVDEQNTKTQPDVKSSAYVVKAEWFWASVQNEEAENENEYLFEDYLEAQSSPSRRSSRGSLSSSGTSGSVHAPPSIPCPTSPPATPTCSTPSHHGHNNHLHHHSSQQKSQRKRKLRGPESALHKRRSSVGDAVLMSLSGNLLDCTQSPDGKQSLLDEVECVSVSDAARKRMSPRQQVFMELLQTESNYVGILHTIMNLFKQPLEEMSEDESGSRIPILNNTELKIIFGNLPPIYEIHRRMLEELKGASFNWTEETSIGRIVLKYSPDLVKAYPPFVNFFENMKEMIHQCDRDKPRFHAFLKICQSRDECGKQSLQELLIRPVQRLPSITLLLEDILKHTHKSNPDHCALEAALSGVREVLAHVNEDKRKTEGQLQMFDIYNDIDNCPPHLVSSHRSFVSRCEVVEISKDLSGRGDHLVLFLFTDVMEVCKKRSKVFNSKSPPMNGHHHAASKFGSGKPYRHIQLMPLSTVKRVIDIRESEECHKVFALMCRSNQELKEKLYSFAITEEQVDKTQFLKQLCRQMANTVCKADAEKFLACLDSHQLDIDTSDVALTTLSKAFKFASRTRLKFESMAAIPWFKTSNDSDKTNPIENWVGRAFSFNKTPSKLKRAMSSMISPFGSTSNLTPSSQFSQMRLASCNNINELGVSAPPTSHSDVLVAPMSVQPTRKAKAASLSSAGHL